MVTESITIMFIFLHCDVNIIYYNKVLEIIINMNKYFIPMKVKSLNMIILVTKT